MTMVAPDRIILSDGREFIPGRGGAGSPDLAFMIGDKRHYVDPLPWCELLGALGYPREGFRRAMEFRSVTTSLGELPTHALNAWYGAQAAECGAQQWLQRQWDRWGRSEGLDRVLTAWVAKAGERARDRAGERGTLIHDIAEDGEKIIHQVASDLLEHRDVDPWFVETANCAPYVKALIKFFKAYPGIRPIWVEVTVFNRKYGYAGSLDLIAWVPGLGVVLLDWKTSNTVQPKFSFQEAGYAYGEYAIIDGQRVPIPKVDGHYVVHLMPGDPDDEGKQHGAFEVVPMDSDPGQLEIFTAMDIVRRWNHPSRIGRPLPHPDVTGLSGAVFGHEPPDLAVVKPSEAAMAFVAGHYETLPRDLAESVFGPDLPPKLPEPAEPEPLFDVGAEFDRLYREHVDAEKTWLGQSLAFIQSQMSDPQQAAAARYLLGEIVNFWRPNVPPMDHPQFGIDEASEPAYRYLLHMVQSATDELEMPFLARPALPDWDDVWSQLEKAATPPKPTMTDLGMLLLAAQAGTLDPPQGRVVTLAKRAYSIDPDHWGQPADPSLVEECTALANRAAKLPRDFIEALDAWKLENGLPNLRTISMTREHLEMVSAKVDEMFATWTEELTTVMNTVIATVAKQDRMEFLNAALAIAAPGCDTFEECTGQELERIMLLCRGVQRGDLGMAVENDDIRLISMVDPITLVGRYGTRTTLRNVAREVAARLGIPGPRSVADAAANVVLVAALGEDDPTGGIDASEVTETGSDDERGSARPEAGQEIGDSDEGGEGIRRVGQGVDQEPAEDGEGQGEGQELGRRPYDMRRDPFDIGEDRWPGPTE